MEADRIVDLVQLIGGQAEGLAAPGVALVLVGDDRVDAVVAAVELDDDQDAAVLQRRGGPCRRGEEPGYGRRHREERCATQ